MKQIVVALTKRRNKFNLLSRIIRLIEGTSFSHVAFMVTSSTGRTLIYEASGLSVKFSNPRLFYKTNTVIRTYKISLDEMQQKRFIDLCFDNLGAPYSVMGLIGILFVRLFKLKSNPFKDETDSFICSELVAFLLKEFYPKDLAKYDLDAVGIREIREILDTIAVKEF